MHRLGERSDDAGAGHRTVSDQWSRVEAVTDLLDSDELVCGSAQSDILYVTSDSSVPQQQIFESNLKTGYCGPFVSLSPFDPADITAIWKPTFSRDENRWIYNQARSLSSL
jgi:hypothetical protein